ncbi:neural cell adhesion molecule L1-like protein isoform X1 [Sander lucioperca]|uniref:neural cell adhesion molecule L1-like protein isoform X1 n=1 Tax=Sander lucioperca TaxID=283035 RepID=UPI0016536B0C|nr:neural cell adhesion molecule L1-like protein isoform X1 [Sander lucioperca]XP_035863853.1 neural cell adhesion molecule L1-like protein isoform X1 [Sander lucioperca]XP_035863854.1 neural cell adhesion molecule L1-like protein isoform X1 [Sander lucioperca]
MRGVGSLQLVLLLALTSTATGLNIPLEVEQPPTIITHTAGPIIALPFDNTITIRCEARGNPPPEYRWTKDGKYFIPPHETDHTDGTLVLPIKHLEQYRGKYRCYTSNKLGTAMTEEIELKVPSVPKFPKEYNFPIVVKEGEPITLECNPPEGVAPRQIYWMTLGLEHIEQDERVSMGIDGNLYFSNALLKDSRQDYCCFAAFSKIRTIAQKTAMAVVVKSLKRGNESADSDNATEAPAVRIPGLLLPSGVQTEKVLLKGEHLQLECIPQGYPTPKISWMKMGDSLPPRTKYDNFGKLLSLSDVDERDAGKYLCKAQNSAGEAVHYFDVIVEEPPKWLTEPPPSQLTVIGSDVYIKCSVSGKPQPEITWRRNGEFFRDDPENNRRVLDDTVVLHNARPEDSAVYQCEASNSHGSVLANINIMVINMAPRILTRDNQKYAVVLGGDVIMNCSVFSSPPSKSSWSNDEKAIEGERFLALSGYLQIIGAEKNDSGEYVCVASNTEGKSAVTAYLDVKDPTKIVIPPQDVQIISGTTAQLMCQAEYDKSLRGAFEVVWRKDGEEIPLSFEENSRYFVDDNMLQIMNVNQSDQGIYTCIARTSLDEDNATALLTVLDIPDAPKNVKISELKSLRNVHLSWIPGSDHNSSVTEFIVEYEENQWDPGRWKELQKVPGNQATAELSLRGHLNYQFRVYAVNAVGPGPPSEPTERYQTPPAAPERNPENIKIQGHLPHQMDISWEPLLPIEHNGPGLEYKVSYRKLGVEDDWREHLVKRHSFVVKNTSTFVPYEIKIQSRNSHGWGPDPKVVTGYSGEDVVFWHCVRENVSVPTAEPRDVAVEVINTTVLRVSWTPAPPATVRGHLGGYDVHWSRKRSLLNPNKILEERQTLSFPGKRTHAIVPGLKPFSEYRLTVSVFNKKGNGPNSDPVTFNTPEGVPAQLPILTASNAQKDSILLVWGPPLETNGILTGYLLQYHLINETTLEVVDSQEKNITEADTTQWQVQGLEEGRLYRFHLSACTRAGCGPALAQESSTVAQAHLSPTPAVAPVQSCYNCSLSFPSSIAGNSSHLSLVPALLNISSYVSDTFAKISWTAREEQQDSELYVAYMNNRDGNWRISEAVNTSQSFHVIDGLKPGTVYTVRLMAKRLLDNASIFEDVIKTQVKGAAGQRSDFSTQGWFIGTMCAVALLTLVTLMACFVRRNKGGKYAGTLPPTQRRDMFSMEKVKEKEDLHPDVESQGMNDDTFCEYSDSEEKPLKGSSLCSLNDALGDSISRDSLVDYADGGREFNEDGSFIGEYSGHKHGGSVSEPSGPRPVTA